MLADQGMKRWIPTWPSFCACSLRLDAHKLERSRRVRAEDQKQKWPNSSEKRMSALQLQKSLVY